MAAEDGKHLISNYSSRCSVKVIHPPTIMQIDSTPCAAKPFDEQLRDMGFDEVEEFINTAGDTCLLVQAHLAECPACSQAHMDDRYQIRGLMSQCRTLKNMDPSCQERIISFAQLMKDPILEQILERPTVEAPYADLYCYQQKGTLLSDGVNFYRFDGQRWIKQADAEVTRDMQHWLRVTFRQFNALLHYEQSCVENANHMADKRNINKVLNTVVKARTFVETEHKVKNLTSNVKREVLRTDLDRLFDADPYLLGMEEGVVDLRACVWRPSRMDDYVTMSTGYKWEPHPSPVVEAEVDNFMRQVGIITICCSFCWCTTLTEMRT